MPNGDSPTELACLEVLLVSSRTAGWKHRSVALTDQPEVDVGLGDTREIGGFRVFVASAEILEEDRVQTNPPRKVSDGTPLIGSSSMTLEAKTLRPSAQVRHSCSVSVRAADAVSIWRAMAQTASPLARPLRPR